MPFIDTNKLEIRERRPGWRGRFFDSPSMSFADYSFDKDAWIHEHHHPQEEVWQIIAGELAITIDGETIVAGPGHVAIVPAGSLHAVRALSAGRALIVDHPLRAME
jgi:quercetin dioxygenase-like cupin family protein